MSTRNTLLEEKALEVTEQLSQWARQNDVLQVGEQIAFSLSIRSAPIVVQTTSDNILEMKPHEFFTKERLREAGFQSGGAYVRIMNGMINAGILSVGEMMTWGRSRLEHRIVNFGRRSGEAVSKVLAAHGIELPE